ncbi:hypothetical protein MKW92_047662 [Papaver armeniacum]|nr:hypothetical protein MKW92_047662 [Papaver armeniacum]
MNRLIKLFFILTITIMTLVIDLTSAMPMRGQQGNYNGAMLMRGQQGNYNGAIDKYYAAMLAASIKYFNMETLNMQNCAYEAEQAPIRRFPLTCQNNPMICNNVNKGNPPGTNQCCMKKCVNILEGKNNCGVCGHKCKYSETSFFIEFSSFPRKKKINPSYNPRHCGSCYNRCSKGASCSFGLCNYS